MPSAGLRHVEEGQEVCENGREAAMIGRCRPMDHLAKRSACWTLRTIPPVGTVSRNACRRRVSIPGAIEHTQANAPVNCAGTRADHVARIILNCRCIPPGVVGLICVVVIGGLTAYVLTRPTVPVALPEVPRPPSLPTGSPARASPDFVARPTIPDTAEVVAPPIAAPSGASAVLYVPRDGARVVSPVVVKMAVTGIHVAPAGSTETDEGHFHLLIDAYLDDVAAPMRRDARHLDFGDGTGEAAVDLPVGKHTLQLVMGDGNHVPHNPPVVSTPIAITVEPAK